ncbi:MAG: helix-turn-helix domain-containing protein [Planctomycetota bacterium]
MSIHYTHPEALSRLFDLRQGENPITWRTFGVGAALATFMDMSGKCFPSRAAIAKRAGLDHRAVSRALHELELRGFIQIISRPGTSNTLCLPLVVKTQGQIDTPGRKDPPSPGQNDPPPLGQNDPPKEPIKKPMKELIGTDTGSTSSAEAVPSELKGMELYETDMKLCAAWAGLQTSWARAYPDIDYLAEVAKAHAWEVANPQRRKTDRPRFLTNWLARVANNPQQNQPSEEQQCAEEQFEHASMAYAVSGIEEALSRNHTKGDKT